MAKRPDPRGPYRPEMTDEEKRQRFRDKFVDTSWGHWQVVPKKDDDKQTLDDDANYDD